MGLVESGYSGSAVNGIGCLFLSEQKPARVEH